MKSYFQKQTSSFNLCSRIVFQIYEYTKLVQSESDTEMWSLSLGMSDFSFHFALFSNIQKFSKDYWLIIVYSSECKIRPRGKQSKP